jgi:hypothetical protein
MVSEEPAWDSVPEDDRDPAAITRRWREAYSSEIETTSDIIRVGCSYDRLREYMSRNDEHSGGGERNQRTHQALRRSDPRWAAHGRCYVAPLDA